MFFKFLIYDFHYKHSLEDTEIYFTPNLEDDWLKFHFVLNYNDASIMAYRSWILFDNNKTPTECTKVFLDNGDVLFAAYKLNTFESNLNAFLKDFKEID